MKGAKEPWHEERGKAASLGRFGAEAFNDAAADDADISSSATPAAARLSAAPQVPFAPSGSLCHLEHDTHI